MRSPPSITTLAGTMPAGAGVAIEGEDLVGVDSASTIRAFARSNGAPRWSSKLLAYRRLSSPGSRERWVAVGDHSGYIVAQPLAVGAGVLVQSQRGYLVLLMPQT